MNKLFARISLFSQVITDLFLQDKLGFVLTTFFCAGWRILVIGAYAFALKTIVDVYQQGTTLQSDIASNITPLAIVFGAFTLSGAFDIIYTRFRQRFNNQILDTFVRLGELEINNSKTQPSGSKNSHAIVVSKCFDAFLGLLLFITGLTVIGFISTAIFSLFFAMLPVFAIIYYMVKKYFSSSVTGLLKKNNKIDYQNVRILRASVYRFVSQVSAGVFVIALCAFILNSDALKLSILQVAILGFSIRFSISFLSMFLLNLVSVLDQIDVLRYFVLNRSVI